MIPSPSSLTITPEILSLVAELDEFKGAWRASTTLPPERMSALRREAFIESIGASIRIDGGRLTNAEVSQLLWRIEGGVFASRDEQEAAGYAEALGRILTHPDSVEIRESGIRDLHRVLVVHRPGRRPHQGTGKSAPNPIDRFDADGRMRFAPIEAAPPTKRPYRMSELVEWLRGVLGEGGLHPLLAVPIFTLLFLANSPFQDGNRRLSRLQTTLLLLRAGYTHLPFSSLDHAIEQNKERYYEAMRLTMDSLRESSPNWQPWLIYHLRALRAQKQRLESEIHREEAIAESLPELSARILKLAREQGRLTVSGVVENTGANRNTVKKHLQSLVRADRLLRRGKGKGTWYARR